MDKITPPKTAGIYPDRAIDCDEAMDRALADMLDAASQAGWSIPEALDAIARVLPDQRHAYAMDPDPADDLFQ